MPYQVSWQLEGRIILLEFSGDVSIEDIRDADRENAELITQQDATVHVIFSVQRATRVPLNLYAISKQVSAYKLPNFGYTVVFGTSAMVASFIKSVSKVIRLPIYSVASLSDALAYLREKDPSLEADFSDQEE